MAEVISREKRKNPPVAMNEDAAVEVKFTELMAEMEDNWFLNYWMAFVLLSTPAGPRCVPCFQTASAASIQSSFIPISGCASRSNASRAERRQQDRIAAGQAIAFSAQSTQSNVSTPTMLTANTPDCAAVVTEKNVFVHNVIIEKRARADDSAGDASK